MCPTRVCVVLVLSALSACVVDDAGSRTSAIVNGEQVEGTEPATVAVLNRFGGLCTGTLIAPRVVLTAKHCVQNPGASEPGSPGAFVIGVGDNINRLERTFSVSDVVTTPGVYSDRGGLSGALVGIDIALVTTTTVVDGVTPIPVHRGDPRDLIGQDVRAVGFGQIPSGSAGRKYRTVNDIVNVAGNVIYMNPTICQGDSGGPLLTMDPEEVVGIASFGTGACGSGRNGHNVVYAFLEMVDDAIRASGVCVGDGEEVCDGEDNDCDDAVDEDCSRVGETCTDDSECVTLLCREIDGARICTQDCNPLRPFSSCPPSMFCATTAGCDGQCVFGEEGAGMNDETCEDATDCASLFCADPGDGRKRCLDPCMGDAGTCLAGDVCAAPPMACGGCVPAALVGEARGIGEPCEGPESCRSEICFTEESASYCSRDCTVDSDCGEAFHCRPPSDASPGRCVRGERGGVGSGCVDNPDCGEGFFCAALGETRWCTSFCRETDECPPEFTCELVGEDTSICVPERGVVGAPCMGADECISALCEPVGVEEALICSRECGGDAPCDPGFECRRSEDGSVAYCTRTLVPEVVESGGCATGGASAGSGFFLFLLIFAARRRRSISRGSHAS